MCEALRHYIQSLVEPMEFDMLGGWPGLLSHLFYGVLCTERLESIATDKDPNRGSEETNRKVSIVNSDPAATITPTSTLI